MKAESRNSLRFRSKPRKAFTLIELLVVIAIIALLVSILLPSLNKARELAKTTVCLTTLKNLGTSMVFYTNDFNKFPPYHQSGTGGYGFWYWEMADKEYIDGMAGMFCPNHKSQSTKKALFDSGFPSYGLSMGIWFNYSDPANGGSMDKLPGPDDFANPTETILAGDCSMVPDTNNFGGYYAFYGGYGPDYGLTPTLFSRHENATCNVLWMDSHVTSARAADPDDPHRTLYDPDVLTSAADDDNYWDRD